MRERPVPAGAAGRGPAVGPSGVFWAERAVVAAARQVRAVVAAGPLGEGRQVRAEIWRARAKSLAVRPPAEWVLRVSVTLFHAIAMSGW
jgi:hypothetical protein